MLQNPEGIFATVEEYKEAIEDLEKRKLELEKLERELHIEFIGVEPADDKRVKKDFFEDWPKDVKEKFDNKKTELEEKEKEIESRKPLNLVIEDSIKRIEEI